MTRNYYMSLAIMLIGFMSMLPTTLRAGATYTDQAAKVNWQFNNANDYTSATSMSPEGAFSFATADVGASKVVNADAYDGVTYLKINPATGATDAVKWSVKPAKGLTFTPTKVSAGIIRFGTDAADGVTVTAVLEDGTSEVLGTFTAARNSGTDKYSSNSNWTRRFEIELTAAQQAKLSTAGIFTLTATIGVNNSKQGGFSDVVIDGKVSGTIEEVEKYTVTTGCNIAGAGEITVSPVAATYDAGSPIKLSAEKNFGYAFVNWTDATGAVVSAAKEFEYTVNANSELTANFKALETFELAYTIEGGANHYQVQPSPEGTIIDGKRMYEKGTNVTLSAVSNPVMTFTNWGDGQNSSEISVKMDADHTDITACFDAVDFIAGWDFYLSGSNGRPADFAAADNDDCAIVMRNAAGESSSWLDKSQQAAGGYEGRPGAVNWKTTGLGEFYWQTRVNASAFTDIRIITAMVFNYNAYTVYDVEYSLNGEDWAKAGSIKMPGAKSWVDATISLPAEANNREELYIRFKADTTSPISGTSSNNDGACLGATYIVGTAQLVNDGTAPVLVTNAPEEGSSNASINGKIVLSFDEKVKVKDGVTATLGDQKLEPTVIGKTVMFEYKNLKYTTDYTFSLEAGAVADLCDNALGSPITINFTTKTKPVVAKGAYDAVVRTAGELAAAINTANSRADKGTRYRIFLYNGTYKMPTSGTKTSGNGKTYPDGTTYITGANISFIGESRDGVIITSTVPNETDTWTGGGGNVLEGIGKSDVLNIGKDAKNCYFQNLTVKSAIGDGNGRDIEVNDCSDKTIMKDVCLWGYQDTYVSNNQSARFYFESSLLRGRTDFLCGKGDVYYNGCTLQMCESGGYLAVPSNPKKYGYIFKDCEIVGEKTGIDGKFTLGRPWGSGSPIALYIDTKMTIKPSAVGWNEMSNGWPARFAEYNSTTSTGTVIDLKDRKKIFGDNHENNPVLTKAEADYHNYARVMGGDDDWDPASDAEQAPLPTNVVVTNGTTISWDDSSYALLWAVCKDGAVIAFTTEPTYSISDGARFGAVYSVRAANAMGGLGEAVEASVTTGIAGVNTESGYVISTQYYNIQGQPVSANASGVLIKVETMSDGSLRTVKVIK